MLLADYVRGPQATREAPQRANVACALTARGFIEMQEGLPVVVDGEMIDAIGASFATRRWTSRSRRRDWPRSASDSAFSASKGPRSRRRLALTGAVALQVLFIGGLVSPTARSVTLRRR